jgi:hypothetical protein
MAQDKKSFIMYADYISMIEKLPDETAGKLLKHLMRYVNDQDPETDDLMVEIAFEPWKANLKRDLKKWEGQKSSNSEAGLKSALLRFEKKIIKLKKDDQFDIDNEIIRSKESLKKAGGSDPYHEGCLLYLFNLKALSTDSTDVDLVATDSTVNDTVNDTDNDTDNVIVNDKKTKSHSEQSSDDSDNKRKPKNKKSKPRAPREKKDPTDYWHKHIALWFEFYEDKMKAKPTFNASAGKQLKSIIINLKKISEDQSFEWTEEYSLKVLKHFYSLAYADQWLKNNFLLSNLLSKFDSIINKPQDSKDGETNKINRQSADNLKANSEDWNAST